MKIVLCDDHVMFSQAFSALLEQRGHEVLCHVPTPAEGLMASRQYRPDVVLLDLRFPNVHGADAVTLLREAVIDLPIVVLTAEPDAELLRQALEAGADGVVLKSEGVAEIEHVMQQVQVFQTGGRGRPTHVDKVWSRQARALAQRQARIVKARNLTPRERQVIVLLVQGKSTAAIANAMNVGRATLHAHLQHLFVKLGVHSRLELVAYAVRKGIVRMDDDSPAGSSSSGKLGLAPLRRTSANLNRPRLAATSIASTNTRRKMVRRAVGPEPSTGTHWAS